MFLTCVSDRGPSEKVLLLWKRAVVRNVSEKNYIVISKHSIYVAVECFKFRNIGKGLIENFTYYFSVVNDILHMTFLI